MTDIARFTGIAAMGLVLSAAGPAIAQAASGQTAQPPASVQSTQDISRKELHKFADALSEIRDIRQSARQDMEQAGNQEARTRVRRQAQQEMLLAIKDSGLTLREYNRIGRAVQANPKLARKVEQMQ